MSVQEVRSTVLRRHTKAFQILLVVFSVRVQRECLAVVGYGPISQPNGFVNVSTCVKSKVGLRIQLDGLVRIRQPLCSFAPFEVRPGTGIIETGRFRPQRDRLANVGYRLVELAFWSSPGLMDTL